MSKKIKVVLVEPGKAARVAEIDNSLESMQSVVGGWIETFYPFEGGENMYVCCVANEEGKLLGLDLNRALTDSDGNVIDIIAGTFFVCDATNDEFESLSDEQLKKFCKRFQLPEFFMRLNGSIISIPYSPCF